MNKLQMAHDYALKLMGRNSISIDEVVRLSFDLADAMQDEADKRNIPEKPDSSEWQPDWSKAPYGYDWFCVGSETNNGYFCNIEPKIIKDKYWFVGEDSIETINHGYTGDWRNSLRKRPQ